jgi:hypothetical protein
VIILGALYALTLGATTFEVLRGWPLCSRTHTQVLQVLESLPVLLFPVGIFFFPYLCVYRRGVRLLGLGHLVPARRLDEANWLQTPVFTYEYEGKTFKASRYLTSSRRADRHSIPVAFVDPECPKLGIIVLVGGEMNY